MDSDCELAAPIIFYKQEKPCNRRLVNVNCVRTGEIGSGKEDCDNCYYWHASQSMINNPESYEWRWYTSSGLYRALNLIAYQSSASSGWIDEGSELIGLIRGVRHRVVVNLVWDPEDYECPQLEWMNRTRCDALVKQAVDVGP